MQTQLITTYKITNNIQITSNNNQLGESKLLQYKYIFISPSVYV